MTSKISIIEFGSLEHQYPIIEVYKGDDLVLEIVTKSDMSVEVLEAEDRAGSFSLADVKATIELCIPAWKAAIER